MVGTEAHDLSIPKNKQGYNPGSLSLSGGNSACLFVFPLLKSWHASIDFMFKELMYKWVQNVLGRIHDC